MDYGKDLILVAEIAGISTSQAETAVRMVAPFLKDKISAAMAGQVDSFSPEKDRLMMLQE